MRDRTTPTPRARTNAATSLDIVLCTAHGRQLAVLLVRTGREGWTLPWVALKPGEALEAVATRTASAAAGAPAAWLTQCGTIGDTRRHPGAVAWSVGFVGVAPARPGPPPAGAQWWLVSELPALPPRQQALLELGVATLRERMDIAPVAFHLLARTFTLSELQEMYELLLGRKLHKASFRRALQAAYLVEPTDEWRSEGRGRPAQLFKFAPRKRRGARRAVRFDLLGG
jgi:8-oxo-dGTP diphosphatase